MGLDLLVQTGVAALPEHRLEEPREEHAQAGHDSLSSSRLTIDTVRVHSARFRGELATAGGGDGVEAGAPVVVADTPGALDPGLLLEPEQRRIDGALVQRQAAVGDLLNPPGDAVAVERAHRRECLEHHQVERAVRHLGVGRGAWLLLLKVNMSLPRFMLKGNRRRVTPDSQRPTPKPEPSGATV